MASEPTELLAIARGLLEGATEAHFRSAANRADYAAFHFGRALVASLPDPPKTGRDSHQRSINRLRKYPKGDPATKAELTIRAIGNLWHKGKRHRVDADYFLDEEFSRGKAEELIGWAEKIQQLIEEVEAQGTSKV